MNPKHGPRHVVVDGSNIATEGRSLPSLAQLSEAVGSFMEEHPDTTITVVVDATFGHRIDKKEAAEFEAGISNNELVAPPAGAIGRGDAFVLSIAQKAGASILSNDSFQEFHADYDWLFDEGRLIGGKPVPHVGWVFVNRSPVRGPVSRKAMQGAKVRGGTKRGTRKAAAGSGSPLANEPMPVPKSPPPRRAATGADQSSGGNGVVPAPVAPAPTPRAGEVVNELMPFLEFVEHHPIGTSVNGIVDAYSSHGAYISIGTDGVRGYIPLRLMSDPPPPSARKVMQIGEAVTVVVVSFAAARRSIDCAMPDMAGRAPVETDALAADPVEPQRSGRRGRGRKVAEVPAADDRPADFEAATSTVESAAAELPATDAAPAPTSRRTRAKKSTAAAPLTAGEPAPTAVDGAATDGAAPATKVAPKKAAAKKAPAKTAPAKTAPAKTAPAKKAPAKKAAAKTTAARKTTAKNVPATKTPATTNAPHTTAPAGNTTVETVPAPPAAVESAPARKSQAKKAAAKKSPAKKSPARKAAARKSAAAPTASPAGTEGVD